jgi:hypothetical protein
MSIMYAAIFANRCRNSPKRSIWHVESANLRCWCRLITSPESPRSISAHFRQPMIGFSKVWNRVTPAPASRARLCAEQGEGQKAFDILSPIYGWFAAGFETPDLLQARTLLGELRN